MDFNKVLGILTHVRFPVLIFGEIFVDTIVFWLPENNCAIVLAFHS